MNIGEKTHLDKIEGKVDMIIRGMYGDDKNKVKGMLDRMDEVEYNWTKVTTILDHAEDIPKVISAYEFWNSKLTWVIISVALGGLYFLIENWKSLTVFF
jgi:hypothetical protein